MRVAPARGHRREAERDEVSCGAFLSRFAGYLLIGTIIAVLLGSALMVASQHRGGVTATMRWADVAREATLAGAGSTRGSVMPPPKLPPPRQVGAASPAPPHTDKYGDGGAVAPPAPVVASEAERPAPPSTPPAPAEPGAGFVLPPSPSTPPSPSAKPTKPAGTGGSSVGGRRSSVIADGGVPGGGGGREDDIRDAGWSNPMAMRGRYAAPSDVDGSPNPRCENFYGHTWLRAFMKNKADGCVPGAGAVSLEGGNTAGSKRVRSRITTYETGTGSRFAYMRNVKLNFGLMGRSGDQRHFSPGFVEAACTAAPDFHADGFDRESGGGSAAALRITDDAGGVECSEWVTTPTLIVSHDDIGNMYHNLADHLRVWLSIAVLQQPLCAAPADANDPTISPAVNASMVYPVPDGYPIDDECRAAGKAVIPGLDSDAMQLMNMDHRIMCNVVAFDGSPLSGAEEDCEGPFFSQYRVWMKQGVVRARDFAGRSVCFASVGWAVHHPETQVWGHFGEEHPCSHTNRLFRQYARWSVFRWGMHDHVPSVVAPAALRVAGTATAKLPYIRLLYVVRRKKPFNPAPVRSRTVANDDELVPALRAAHPGALIEVVEADFTLMTFKQQLEEVRSSHIMFGMHGAGLVHGIHLADADECGGPTALVETLTFHGVERGVQHLVSYTGHKYFRYQNDDESLETDSGTRLKAGAVAAIVRQAIDYNLAGRRPGCVDTTAA